jgi:hypothetical protein
MAVHSRLVAIRHDMILVTWQLTKNSTACLYTPNLASWLYIGVYV